MSSSFAFHLIISPRHADGDREWELAEGELVFLKGEGKVYNKLGIPIQFY